MEAVSGGSRIYHTPTLGSVVNSIKWNHTNLVVARILNSRSRGLTESVMSSSRKCK
ncbi:hypothetical protein HID58_028495, partial [Brassica napus]